MTAPWYATWFNTSFYHDLYQHRDEYEAREFIIKLCKQLNIPQGDTVMDLACGRGRHAKVLSEQGLKTLGVDLSPESIDFAQRYAHEGLQFKVGNMLEALPVQGFDWVMNLFTSFGYFESDDLHQEALSNIWHALKPGGRFVLDFMNSAKIEANLVSENTVATALATYTINRRIEAGTIVKSIKVSHDCTLDFFEERVRAFSAVDLRQMMYNSGFSNIEVKGDYDLSTYDPLQSDRMIFIAQKPI